MKPRKHKKAPGKWGCLILQCAVPDCEEWFLDKPSRRYCDPHKAYAYANMKRGWDAAKAAHDGRIGGKSRFTQEELLEMRDMRRRGVSIPEIAKHFDVHRTMIYKWLRRPLQNPRKIAPENGAAPRLDAVKVKAYFLRFTVVTTGEGPRASKKTYINGTPQTHDDGSLLAKLGGKYMKTIGLDVVDRLCSTYDLPLWEIEEEASLEVSVQD